MKLEETINLRWFLIGGFPENILGGLALNVAVGTTAFVFSFLFGHLLALGRMSSFGTVRLMSAGYVELIRSVPLLIVLFWFYFSLPILLETPPSPFWSALFALTAYGSAYQAEFIRAGIKDVAQGEIEAARCLGLSRVQVLMFIVLAQAHRRMLPTYASYYTSLFKDSSVLYIVGLVELMQAGLIVAERHPDQMLKVYLTVASLFFIVCCGSSWIGHWLSHRLAPKLATAT